jgi:hypothetical protein
MTGPGDWPVGRPTGPDQAEVRAHAAIVRQQASQGQGGPGTGVDD